MKSTSPLHQQIRAQLIERFQDWPLETRLPSFRDLAEETGVAYLTISGVMKQLEWDGYVKRIPRKGTFLASRERTVERDLHSGTSKLKKIIFAYPNYFSYATWIRLHHAETNAVKSGMGLVEYKMNVESTYDGLADLVKRCDDVSGVVLMPIPKTLTRRDVAMLDGLGVPVVILAGSDFASLKQQVWSVDSDFFRCGYMLAKSLIDEGHEQIGYVAHEPFPELIQQKLVAGMREALQEVGLKQRDLVIAGGSTNPWQDSREAGEILTRELLEAGDVTGAIYGSLRGVHGGLKAARSMGVRVPDDFGVTSIGRGNGDEDYLDPPITTVDPQPADEIKLAFDCLQNPGRQGSRQQTVVPKLNMRESITTAQPFSTSH